LADAVYAAEVWAGRKEWKTELCNQDFDGDGAFRLADAVFAAEVWSGKETWKIK
jgi:hypothetical protein